MVAVGSVLSWFTVISLAAKLFNVAPSMSGISALSSDRVICLKLTSSSLPRHVNPASNSSFKPAFCTASSSACVPCKVISPTRASLRPPLQLTLFTIKASSLAFCCSSMVAMTCLSTSWVKPALKPSLFMAKDASLISSAFNAKDCNPGTVISKALSLISPVIFGCVNRLFISPASVKVTGCFNTIGADSVSNVSDSKVTSKATGVVFFVPLLNMPVENSLKRTATLKPDCSQRTRLLINATSSTCRVQPSGSGPFSETSELSSS